MANVKSEEQMARDHTSLEAFSLLTGIRMSASMKSHRGILTVKYRLLKELMGFVEQNPNADNASELKAALHACTVKFDFILELYTIMLGQAAEDQQNNLEMTMTELSGNQAKLQIQCLEILARNKRATQGVTENRNPAGGAAGQTQLPKVNDSLKPDKLMITNNPTEFRDFAKKFRAYSQTSRMDRLSTENQQMYLHLCLDAELSASLEASIDEETEIFGVDSCFHFLEQEFLANYPRVLRRNALFESRQKSNQTFSAWKNELAKLSSEADLTNMGREDIMVSLYTCGIHSAALKEEILKLQDPTMEQVETLARSWDRAKSAVKALAGGHATAAATSNYKKNKGAPKSDSTDKKDKPCFRCGKTDHLGPACPIKDTAICRNCGKKGHIAKVCKGKTAAAKATKPEDPLLNWEDKEEHDSTPAKSSMIRSGNKPTPTLAL